MRLIILEAKDFLSYPYLHLDLSDIGQLAVVGENGAGKSALLDAILWCVYGLGRGSADEMTREGALGCFVKTTWLRGDQEIVITRSRSQETAAGESSLSLYVDGEKRSGHKISDTQASIITLMGMPAEALLAGPIMVQGESGSFLKAKPAERKDLLVHLFGLERWESYHEAAKVDLAAATKLAERLTADLAVAEATMTRIDEVTLKAREKELTRAIDDAESEIGGYGEANDALVEEGAALKERAVHARSLQREAAEALQDVERAESQLSAQRVKLSAAQSRKAAPEPAIKTEVPPDGTVAGMRDRLATMQQRRDAASQAAHRLASLLREQHSAEQDAERNTPCEGDPPTCRYMVLKADAHARLIRLREEIGEVQPTANQLPALTENLARLQANVDGFDLEQRRAVALRHEEERAHDAWAAQVAAADEQIESATDTIARLEATITEGKAKHRRLIDEAMALQQDEYRMAAVAEELRAIVAAVTELKDRIASHRTDLTMVEREKDRLTQLRADRERAAVGLAAVQQEVDELTVVTAMFHRNGIPTLLLETALPEIEAKANDILSRMPGDFSIRIETQQATKSASFKETLSVIVTAGDNDRAYALLSGGQKFRVDFALRLALSSVIASRYGADVDTLWLDEPLGALDPAGQEAVAQALASVTPDFGLIVVVTHAPTFSELFDTRATVTIADHESSIDLVA